MEPHIGSEQGGKRPVVVLQNNIGNRHSPTLIVATVTTRTEKKKNQPTHVLVDSNPAFEEPSMILLEQIFTIDKSRIEYFMDYASQDRDASHRYGVAGQPGVEHFRREPQRIADNP